MTALTLWACIGLFFLRVVAQIEVLLLEPAWLPPMPAWYSGLLPYSVLLPSQIGLLMLMSVLAMRRSTAAADVTRLRTRSARIWRALALLYFAVMALRLAICVHLYGADFYLHGAIPIALHWVLALFAMVCARTSPLPPASHAGGKSQAHAQRDEQGAERAVQPHAHA